MSPLLIEYLNVMLYLQLLHKYTCMKQMNGGKIATHNVGQSLAIELVLTNEIFRSFTTYFLLS